MRIRGREYRSVWMEDGRVCMIDQRLIPHDFKIASYSSVDRVCEAISTMVVRGAPAIGAAGIYGMALAELTGEDLEDAYKRLFTTRPTAHDLKDALDYYLNSEGGPVERADRYCDESAERCRMIGVHGAEMLDDGMKILTHCNAGALACVDWGTALAPMRVARDRGKDVHVWVDETRPRCQGARLTAWELKEEGISHKLLSDNAAGYLLASGAVDMVIVGADRIAANGDVANKIGTLEKAVLAKEYGIPFYVAAPSSTFDPDCPSGEDIPIEERGDDEVTHMFGMGENGVFTRVRVAYEGCPAFNPAFDVTPARYVTGVITEEGTRK
ncbi:MAG: S-methyl-5-thioribose-1-phosphate isomerase [Candidatus Altiarchaeales archaeon]|nr:S-methyl-5-thioribose-1-phosphate isomerase [Candidatus Altiarchaeales archaeon]MBD3417357.1 S-methyl-5-thioribose-1-phosphate isomerase [Candidatus Altiarchaeales archaeon]